MEHLEKIGKTVQEHFEQNRRLLSFGEYMELVEANPRRYARSAAQYVQDVFKYFGQSVCKTPGGENLHFKLFDAPWENGENHLVGQEAAQNDIYRIISNFVRQRRVDKFILLHGPNGSSKSTLIELISRGLEYYSTLDEGVLYRFNWIFPSGKVSKSGIGFAEKSQKIDPRETFAHLEDQDVDARLFCELHDHPLLLIPQKMRAKLLEQFLLKVPEEKKGHRASKVRGKTISESVAPLTEQDEFLLGDYLLKGDLCFKCKQIFEALLNSYQGDYLRVLRHVQVERFFVSRRYRHASARVEPQLAVDAGKRQVTADRSLAALPTALQTTTLYEFDGDLVQANRGVIDYQDLLKRPIEHYKYLLTTVEDGRVVLDQINLFLDQVFLGSSNDIFLEHFKESPEWMSFKGRFELIRVPYLLDYRKEREIYDCCLQSTRLAKHIAPHATSVAAIWAVLTRLQKPDGDRYDRDLRRLIARLSPLEKAELYSSGNIPSAIKGEEGKLLKSSIARILADAETDREGGLGASPREIKTIIMNAAQNTNYLCLSPLAVLDELQELVKETSVYAYLRMETDEGYHDHKQFIEAARDWYADKADGDMRRASGLVDETSYTELFTRYMAHVTHYVSKEKIRNPITGDFEEPDQRLLGQVEKELGMEGDAYTFRQGLISKVGAWSLDHRGEKPDYTLIFPDFFERLRAGYFEQQSKRLQRILRDALQILSGEASSIPEDNRNVAQKMLDQLKSEFGYCDHCAREAIVLLIKKRYAQ